MRHSLVTATLLIAVAIACEQKPKNEPAPTATVQPARETLPAKVDPQPVAIEQPPVSEDFEEQATREITAANLDTELDKLEQEIPE